MADDERELDLEMRLVEATEEIMTLRRRCEAAAFELDRIRGELDAVCQELALIRASRSYQAAERVRRLLRR